MTVDPARLQQARDLAQAGSYDEALAVFAELHASDPGDLDVLFMVGACHFRRGSIEEARKVWESILASEPGHPKATAWLAKLPASSSEAASPGWEPSPEAAPAQAAKAGAKQAAPRGKAQSPARSGWLKWAVLGVLVLGIAGLVFDMVQNPQSYPFLPKKQGGGQDLQVGSTSAPAPVEQSEPLAPNLPGRWSFLWNQNPATVTFHPEGNVAVEIDQGGGAKISFQGSWKIEEGAINLENLNFPGAPEPGSAKLFDAKIVRSRLTFHLEDPNGPEVSAIKQ
jgi:hypothetical protein